MSIITDLTIWTQETFAPLGVFGLFILAFIEASFFPIPPDVLLFVFVLATPSTWFWLALICTVGSVLGGLFGYWIGYVGERAILERFFSHSKIERVHKYFDRWGAWAVFISGFTPIPYKIFTIAAGVCYIDLKKFMIASILGRGLRYFVLAFLVAMYGEVIMTFIDTHFGWLTLASVALLGAVWWWYRKRKKKRKS